MKSWSITVVKEKHIITGFVLGVYDQQSCYARWRVCCLNDAHTSELPQDRPSNRQSTRQRGATVSYTWRAKTDSSLAAMKSSDL